MSCPIRNILLLIAIAVTLSLSGCDLLRDEPTTRALGLVRSFTDLDTKEYESRRSTMHMRERLVFDYLRALREQNLALSFGVDNSRRVDADHRQVIVTVFERSDTTRTRLERARFSVMVGRDKDKPWHVQAIELVE